MVALSLLQYILSKFSPEGSTWKSIVIDALGVGHDADTLST